MLVSQKLLINVRDPAWHNSSLGDHLMASREPDVIPFTGIVKPDEVALIIVLRRPP